MNPGARSGRGRRVWDRLEKLLVARGVPYDVRFTRYPGHAAELSRELTADGEEHTLVVVGGDGSVSETLSGISDPGKVMLGYIPIGSGNDFSRYFHFARKPERALETVLARRMCRVMDVGRLDCGENWRAFGVSAGMGFDAGVCHHAAASRMKAVLNRLGLGKLTYLLIALRQLLSARLEEMTVTLDGTGRTFQKVLFLAVMNHPYEGGGFRFCPDADPGDGKLDVIVVAGLSRLKALLLLPTALFGRHTGFHGIYIERCRTVSVRSALSLPVHADGEPAGVVDAITVSIAAQVRVITD